MDGAERGHRLPEDKELLVSVTSLKADDGCHGAPLVIGSWMKTTNWLFSLVINVKNFRFISLFEECYVKYWYHHNLLFIFFVHLGQYNFLPLDINFWEKYVMISSTRCDLITSLKFMSMRFMCGIFFNNRIVSVCVDIYVLFVCCFIICLISIN